MRAQEGVRVVPPPHQESGTRWGQGGEHGPLSSAPSASGGPWLCYIIVGGPPEGLPAWGQDETDSEPQLLCCPGGWAPRRPQAPFPIYTWVLVRPTGPQPSPSILLPGALHWNPSTEAGLGGPLTWQGLGGLALA